MGWIVPAIVIAVIVIAVVWAISIYNGIVTADNKCDNAWQTIDAQLADGGVTLTVEPGYRYALEVSFEQGIAMYVFTVA